MATDTRQREWQGEPTDWVCLARKRFSGLGPFSVKILTVLSKLGLTGYLVELCNQRQEDRKAKLRNMSTTWVRVWLQRRETVDNKVRKVLLGLPEEGCECP